MGQMLLETERAKGNLKVGPVVPAGDHGKPTLAELGLSKRESADAQLLMETERANAARDKKKAELPQVTPPTLKELGLTKRESADAQLLAELPAEDFEKIKAGKKTKAKAKEEWRVKSWAPNRAPSQHDINYNQ